MKIQHMKKKQVYVYVQFVENNSLFNQQQVHQLQAPLLVHSHHQLQYNHPILTESEYQHLIAILVGYIDSF